MKINIPVLVLIFILMLLMLSFGACGGKQDNGESINIVIGDPGQGDGSSSGSGTDSDPDSYSGTSGTDEDPGPMGSNSNENEYGQDISWAPLKEDFRPTFPEYADWIKWFGVPIDYIGGLGSQVEPNDDVKGFVNVREKPSIDAKVIGEMYRESEDNSIWIQINDYYQDNGQLFQGVYSVKADDYTWIPVTNGNGMGSVQGWVALEKVQLWSF